MVEQWQLAQRQSLPWTAKVRWSEIRIRQFVDHAYSCGKEPAVQVSGKDSRVVLDIARRMFPDIKAVYINTRLENPSVVWLAKNTPNTIIVKPEMSFHEVIQRFGIPAISKDVSRCLEDLQNPTDRNAASRNFRLTGVKRDGSRAKGNKGVLAAQWRRLIDCGFKFSNKCCYYLKHKPSDKIAKELNLAPIVGTLATDSRDRALAYMKTGCNNFRPGALQCKPLSIWSEQDVLRYILTMGVEIPECYGDIVEVETGVLATTGESNTGCDLCLFGIMNDPSRIERLKFTQPHRYKYCMETLNYRELLPLIFGLPTWQHFKVMLNSPTRQMSFLL